MEQLLGVESATLAAVEVFTVDVHAGVHAGVAAAFGRVHGRVGLVQQLLGVGERVVGGGDADTGAWTQRAPVPRQLWWRWPG